MQNLYGILLRWRSGGVPHLIKRAYTKRVKQGGRPCPPCDNPKVKLPQTAKVVQEKICNPCRYQALRKHLPPLPPPKEMKHVYCKDSKPCKGQTQVNQCTFDRKVDQAPACPEGNWSNNSGNTDPTTKG